MKISSRDQRALAMGAWVAAGVLACYVLLWSYQHAVRSFDRYSAALNEYDWLIVNQTELASVRKKALSIREDSSGSGGSKLVEALAKRTGIKLIETREVIQTAALPAARALNWVADLSNSGVNIQTIQIARSGDKGYVSVSLKVEER